MYSINSVELQYRIPPLYYYIQKIPLLASLLAAATRTILPFILLNHRPNQLMSRSSVVGIFKVHGSIGQQRIKASLQPLVSKGLGIIILDAIALILDATAGQLQILVQFLPRLGTGRRRIGVAVTGVLESYRRGMGKKVVKMKGRVGLEMTTAPGRDDLGRVMTAQFSKVGPVELGIVSRGNGLTPIPVPAKALGAGQAVGVTNVGSRLFGCSCCGRFLLLLVVIIFPNPLNAKSRQSRRLFGHARVRNAFGRGFKDEPLTSDSHVSSSAPRRVGFFPTRRGGVGISISIRIHPLQSRHVGTLSQGLQKIARQYFVGIGQNANVVRPHAQRLPPS
mmetsp:Transcript_6937/g.19465  ORF Transcript_6937/g.19465 Transcript_6937/m.19465 type:complete len:335 (+) Transcript_6937:904-1908(+)